ncbi:uncharacterized protein I206_101490 [Kwoniella pini CBS 10737]|uniref:Uncharacterized protein n=1 Tax=Kwoniella pini CBS 10737 TaxID=1296096 RepID=A0A1B9HWI5_9TREE|nr:uncharacterized protein I206_06537 [Kwoniella pini CBS 10737]OCF47634.1 hypothetical protein I206_06537 [Kwoniella pini CBS 10737]
MPLQNRMEKSETPKSSISSSSESSDPESETEGEDGKVQVYTVMLETTDPGLSYSNPPTIAENQGVYFTWKEAKNAAKSEIENLGFHIDEVLDDLQDNDYVDDDAKIFDIKLEGSEGEQFNVHITNSLASKSAPRKNVTPTKKQTKRSVEENSELTVPKSFEPDNKKRKVPEKYEVSHDQTPASESSSSGANDKEGWTLVYILLKNIEWDGTKHTEVEGLYWTYDEAKDAALIELENVGYDKEQDFNFDDNIVDEEVEEFSVRAKGAEERFHLRIDTNVIRTPTFRILKSNETRIIGVGSAAGPAMHRQSQGHLVLD